LRGRDVGMRNFAFLLAAFACAVADAKEFRVAFVGPLSGPLAERTAEYLAGARDAAEAWGGSDAIGGVTLSVVAIDDRDDAAGYRELASALAKEKPAVVVGAPSGRCLEAFSALARRQRVPVLLLDAWEPRYSLDPKRTLLHLSCGAVDHAIWAANYAMRPLEAKRAAAIYDGSPPSIALAEAFRRNLPPSIADGGAHAWSEDLPGALAKDGVDLAFVAADADVALAAATARGGPRLLFADGLATPSIVAAAPADARFLEGNHPYFEEQSLPGYRKRRAKAGLPPSPLAERGYAAVDLFVEVFRPAEGGPRDRLETLRAKGDPRRKDAPLFTEWGQARLFECFLMEPKEGRAVRVEPLYLPSHAGGDLLRFRPASRFQADPEGQVVVLTWGEGVVSTVDRDLRSLGATSNGYQPDMDAWVKDELLSRAIARLNKLFWRNADGTPIPDVSFRIGFTLETPKGVKPHKVWTVTIAGDDPEAGGRAFPPNRAFTYLTFLERTMYRKHKLDPPLRYEDYAYFTGKYRWGESLEKNLRHDRIRSLLDGLAGAIAMTTAHECGHLAGCGHDTTSPRSIMNVAEGAGLEPAWAEWVPQHVEFLDRRLGRAP